MHISALKSYKEEKRKNTKKMIIGFGYDQNVLSAKPYCNSINAVSSIYPSGILEFLILPIRPPKEDKF